MLENLDTVTVVTLLVGVVIPLVVAVVTKWQTTSKFKNIALLATAALSAVLVPHVGSAEVDVQAVATAFLQLFGVSTLTYLGFYKPSGVTEAIQAKIPGGLGPVVE
jgi:hypothetical protein